MPPPFGSAASRVNRLVARYSDLGKGALASPFDEVKVTVTPPRGHSPERAVVVTASADDPEVEENSPGDRS